MHPVAARAWFRDFRRSRPFWGALWLLAAGSWIVYWSAQPAMVLLRGGWSTLAGPSLGGLLAFFGLTALARPSYAKLAGLLGVAVAVVAFVGSNLGGYLVGTLLGIVGGSLTWSWGPSRRRGAGDDAI